MEGKLRNDPKYLRQTMPVGSAYALSLHEFIIAEAKTSNKPDAGDGR